MIIIYHYNSKVVQIERNGKEITFSNKNISQSVFETASQYPDELIMWCHADLKFNLNISEFATIFHHKKIMACYNPSNNPFLPDAIGYVEATPFIKINKNVTYPTWQMSSWIGGIHASILQVLSNEIKTSKDFDYFLHSLAKLAMQVGLFCYSEPKLLKNSTDIKQQQNTKFFILFRFVKQHYKTRWTFLLFLNLFLYERKIAFWPFVFSLIYSKRKLKINVLDTIKVKSIKKVIDLGTIDVIIPTIGRKEYLYDVLKDLSKQTHLPENVIIIEQNPTLDSTSELDYLTTENWPFVIKHTFTHQTGVCNARNLALKEVKSEWVFLNDDDNRFDFDLIENVLDNIAVYGIKAASASYLQINEKQLNKVVIQSPIFGSGNSFIHSGLLKTVRFNHQFEFGYGEDSDFGMQIRNQGVDIVYFPKLEILHLKAPIGGFRTKPVLAWQNAKVLPKPSPTVMLYKQLYLSKEQIKGYKTILFFKFYKVQTIKNPMRYFLLFKKKWEQSEYWANKLKN